MTAPNITATHAFSTRFGGVSSGIFASLNLGLNTDDDLSNVKENYKRLCDAISASNNAVNISCDEIVFSNQVHGTHIRTVTDSDCGALFTPGKPQADGLITNTPGTALMVFTADCVPILLHDPLTGTISAVHAGWRGTAAGIAGIAVQKMITDFGCDPKNIKAAIGPCISACCYEVGSDVADSLQKAFCDVDIHKIPKQENENIKETKYKVDLKEYNRLILFKAGLRDILVSDECTCCSNDKYWSHRFTKGKRGSQVSVIKI